MADNVNNIQNKIKNLWIDIGDSNIIILLIYIVYIYMNH